jgi:hypothetical protein
VKNKHKPSGSVGLNPHFRRTFIRAGAVLREAGMVPELCRVVDVALLVQQYGRLRGYAMGHPGGGARAVAMWDGWLGMGVVVLILHSLRYSSLVMRCVHLLTVKAKPHSGSDGHLNDSSTADNASNARPNSNGGTSTTSYISSSTSRAALHHRIAFLADCLWRSAGRGDDAGTEALLRLFMVSALKDLRRVWEEELRPARPPRPHGHGHGHSGHGHGGRGGAAMWDRLFVLENRSAPTRLRPKIGLHKDGIACWY